MDEGSPIGSELFHSLKKLKITDVFRETKTFEKHDFSLSISPSPSYSNLVFIAYRNRYGAAKLIN
jgi:hypothetical protein